MTVDKIIIGAGLYGLYAAQKCGAAGQRVLVLERDPAPFMRATYINQARVHMGYHYPRSYSTAIKSAHYFQRFCRDYDFCLHTSFDQIYATSAHFSWTNAAEFRRFCAAAKIRYDDVAPERYFNNGMCDGAFLTTEYTYDAQVLKNWFLEQLAKLPNVQVLYSHKPDKIEKSRQCVAGNGRGYHGGSTVHLERNLCGRERYPRHAGPAAVQNQIRKVRDYPVHGG